MIECAAYVNVSKQKMLLLCLLTVQYGLILCPLMTNYIAHLVVFHVLKSTARQYSGYCHHASRVMEQQSYLHIFLRAGMDLTIKSALEHYIPVAKILYSGTE